MEILLEGQQQLGSVAASSEGTSLEAMRLVIQEREQRTEENVNSRTELKYWKMHCKTN